MSDFRINRDHCSPRAGQSGLALIEVLVAVLILGIGLLGLAALQVTSTQMTTQSQQKSQAILLAQDMIERVRANRSNAGDYNMTVDETLACRTNFVPPAGSTNARDEAEWENSVRCLLADGGGNVRVQGSPDRVTVTLNWESRLANDPGNLTMTAHY